ncbi:cation:proton antiporter [Endozoicomonas elysicola]|uniref:Potassium transporter n=1 Tax=Endozoicomonas elysicola TaxID=305900 RepID=A0A081KCA3_9GAMM|nr:cation:proton antiporter [Endozoicomonas elysicola]KEI71779.1 hypothetical protein GV64_14460 [Endozoicomonas elysicola]
MDFTFFNQLMLILALSAVTIAFFKRFQLPESLGYLFVGIILGPTTSGLIQQDFDIALLAEIGVVFLLFTLGLEFSMKTIMAMKKEVFGLGGLQVLLTGMGIFGILMAFDFALLTSLVCASALALSSTAIVSKELTQSNEIRSRQGQLAIGVLLFQDIAAVIFLIMIPALIGGSDSIASSLGFAFAEGVVFVVIMLAIGKWVLPIIFHEVAKARSEELFVLMALVIALMAAWLSHAMDLSMALGGFVAGMMMGESHYKHQVEADIKPFRDVLLGLFFVSVGLMLNMNVLADFWKEILLGTVALIVFKFLVIYTLARTFSETKNISLRTSLSLAQGGEFCFALVALASQYGESGGDLTSIVLAVTILSMIIAPLLIRNSNAIVKLVKFDKSEQSIHRVKEEEVRKQTAHIHHHTLICGYGRVGQTIARFLTQENKAYVAIDDDPIHVHEAGLAGDPVFFGDCRKLELLMAVGLERASQVVICIDRPENALKILEAVRQQSPQIPVLVRTRDDSQSDELKKAGATVVIPEVLESSLVIVKHALLMLGMNPAHVRQRVHEARTKGYEILNGFYPGLSDYLLENDKKTYRHAVTLSKNCKASQKTIESLDFKGTDVSIVEVRRDNMVLQPQLGMILQTGDIVVLTGSNSDISHIEKLFD